MADSAAIPPLAAPVQSVRVDLQAVLELTATIATSVVRQESVAVDRDAQWPEAGMRAMLDSGLGGLVVGNDRGGLGHGLLATAQVCETLGRECASTALCFGMHLVASAVINAKATPEQRRDQLEPINAGRHITTLALSEPGTGAHFYLPQVRMETCEDDALLISGTKSFVTNGGHADSYVVSTVAADRDAPPGLFSCVVVPSGSSGLKWGEAWRGVGMRGNSSTTLRLNDVRVPRANLLGEPGDQIWYVFEVVAPYFLMAMAGTYLGVADAALDEVRRHLTNREYDHTGTSLAQQQLLQHRVGQMWGSVARCRALLYRAAASGDVRPAEALLEILTAKAEVAETAVTVVNEAMTLVGGAGYRENARLGRLLRDARAAHVMSPTTDLLRVWTGRAFLGLPLLSEHL